MNKQIKVLYGMLLMMIFVLWVSSILLLVFQISSSTAIIFVCLLGYMLIACVSEFRNMVKRKVADFSVCLSAISFVTCLFYLVYLGLLLVRLTLA